MLLLEVLVAVQRDKEAIAQLLELQGKDLMVATGKAPLHVKVAAVVALAKLEMQTQWGTVVMDCKQV
jgi:hypothetical protein